MPCTQYTAIPLRIAVLPVGCKLRSTVLAGLCLFPGPASASAIQIRISVAAYFRAEYLLPPFSGSLYNRLTACRTKADHARWLTQLLQISLYREECLLLIHSRSSLHRYTAGLLAAVASSQSSGSASSSLTIPSDSQPSRRSTGQTATADSDRAYKSSCTSTYATLLTVVQYLLSTFLILISVCHR